MSTSWGLIEVSPKAFLSVTYRDTFRVNVYRQETGDNLINPAQSQYYYSPALILDPTSTVCAFNQISKRYEVTFSVIMWDADFEAFVLNEISKEIKATLPKNRLRTLPIEEIRIDSSEQNYSFEIMNKWMSYASQPATFSFRLRCLTNETCVETASNIQADAVHFTSDLKVFYSLQVRCGNWICASNPWDTIPLNL